MKSYIFIFVAFVSALFLATYGLTLRKFQNSCAGQKLLSTPNRTYQPLFVNMSPDKDAEFKKRVMLKEEIASPLRKLRYFFYLSAVSGGGLGFFTSIAPAFFALKTGTQEDIQRVLTNVAVDLGGIVVGVALWLRESNDERQKLEKFSRLEMLQSYGLSSIEKSEREQKLSKLPVEIQFSQNDINSTRIVSFKDLQEKGKQNIVVIAGNREIVRDALISARLEGNELFTTENIMIVPIVFGEDQLEGTSDSRSSNGFGVTRESLMSASFMAKPAQVNLLMKNTHYFLLSNANFSM